MILSPTAAKPFLNGGNGGRTIIAGDLHSQQMDFYSSFFTFVDFLAAERAGSGAATGGGTYREASALCRVPKWEAAILRSLPWA